MNHLTRDDYASALRVVAQIEADTGDVACLARASMRGLDGHPSEHEAPRLALLRPRLAYLYLQACRAGRLPIAEAEAHGPAMMSLTHREGEVMQWLSRGKTDAEIAALLFISPRTVHKHLEHIYVKLGVETRTAAVMRAFGSLPGLSESRGYSAFAGQGARARESSP